MMAINIFILTIYLFTLGSSAPIFKKHSLDMSYTFDSETIYWPTGQITKFNHSITVKDLVGPGGKKTSYAGGDYFAGEHGGTHIDAPTHFNVENGWSIEQIPIERMVAPAVVLDIRDKVKGDNQYQATIADYQLWEAEFGEMPDHSIFLLCTGWEERYPDINRVYGTDTPTDIASMRMPGMHPDLAEWLLENRNMIGVGIDTPTPDGSRSMDSFKVHILTSAVNVYIIENMKGLCEIPRNGATLMLFPMKIGGGTGAPIRVVGTWGDDANDCSSGSELFRPTLLPYILAGLYLFLK